MAYQFLNPDEYEQQQSQTPVVGAGGIAAGATDTSAGAAQPQASADGSGKFINFDRYINANRDAASQQASSLAGGLNSDVQGQSNALDKRYAQFGKDVTTNSLTDDGKVLALPDYRDKSPGGLFGTVRQGLSSQPVVDYDEALRRSNATYQGPTGLNDTSFYKDWNDFVDNAKATPSASGNASGGNTRPSDPAKYTLGDRVDATRSATGLAVLGGGQTAGARNLNGALLNNAGTAAFGDTRNKFNGFLSNLDAKTAASQKDATSAQTQTAGLAGQWKAAVDNYNQALTANQQRMGRPVDPNATASEQAYIDRERIAAEQNAEADRIAAEEQARVRAAEEKEKDDRDRFLNPSGRVGNDGPMGPYRGQW